MVAMVAWSARATSCQPAAIGLGEVDAEGIGDDAVEGLGDGDVGVDGGAVIADEGVMVAGEHAARRTATTRQARSRKQMRWGMAVGRLVRCWRDGSGRAARPFSVAVSYPPGSRGPHSARAGR